MRLYFYVLLLLLLHPIGNAADLEEGLSDLLSTDYQELAAFSKKLRACEVTEESFRLLFWEGLTKSFDFYKTSKKIHSTDIDRLIATELFSHTDLSHPFKKPEMRKTNLAKAFHLLNQFSGEWHGHWGPMNVHHFWLPVRQFNQAVSKKFTLVGFQSCFTGDGFGWNYLVKEGENITVLGFVYHFNDEGRISAKNPHYAYMNSNNQLTWVSDNHIYHEFICDSSHCFKTRHYVISGVKYEKQTQGLQSEYGFQTIYLPDNEDLPAFKHITLNK
ncbi:hypothetical protein [Costertonia aggregata]|uniref:Uncharacterized protein n=1 Tax=Costertonia aggregata TaxID=343403 RepID=A0A7H9ALP9_9FLAO|nr:hypothetical protein [Costertonia aggregata]QLG44380.1 hypothetical protein HYG79_03140 [Costertonia aggregata]